MPCFHQPEESKIVGEWLDAGNTFICAKWWSVTHLHAAWLSSAPAGLFERLSSAPHHLCSKCHWEPLWSCWIKTLVTRCGCTSGSGSTGFSVAVSEVIRQGCACKKSFQMLRLNFWHADGNAEYSLLVLDAVMANLLA